MIPHSHSISSINPHVTRHHEDSIGDIELQHQGYLSLSQQINASTREGHDVVNRLIMSRLSLGLQGAFVRLGCLPSKHSKNLNVACCS